MSFCVFDHDAVCANESAPNVYGKRCIEADNLLKNEQTLCKHRVDAVKPDETMSNEVCLYSFRGKCNKYLCKTYGRSCPRNSCEACEFFISAYETAQSDNVNHPSHYTQGGIECIKAIEASMTPEEFQGYCKGNVMKYVWRFREKNGLEDLKKAQVYLGWMIESKEKQEKSNVN